MGGLEQSTFGRCKVDSARLDLVHVRDVPFGLIIVWKVHCKFVPVEGAEGLWYSK